MEKQIEDLEAEYTQATRDLIAASERQIVPEIPRLNRELAELARKIYSQLDLPIHTVQQARRYLVAQ